ncbi:helix-turn-helix transcriptional regulator [Micromonospora sp. B9E7]|uniref:helix-turn-helix transcriptional regulator n=1 Tax=Micromonospora sp. B9E7 TaxID=3153574 RepID=UPI00325EE61C
MEHTSPSSSAHSAASQRFRWELRDCRVRRGLTQRALADLVRFSRETVAAVESGRRFGSHEFALRCDDVLGTGGRLAALWPQVAAEQLAADGRRGPRDSQPPRPQRAVPRQRDRRDARDPGAVVDAIDELRELIGQVLNGPAEPGDAQRRQTPDGTQRRQPPSDPRDDQR